MGFHSGDFGGCRLVFLPENGAGVLRCGLGSEHSGNWVDLCEGYQSDQGHSGRL